MQKGLNHNTRQANLVYFVSGFSQTPTGCRVGLKFRFLRTFSFAISCIIAFSAIWRYSLWLDVCPSCFNCLSPVLGLVLWSCYGFPGAHCSFLECEFFELSATSRSNAHWTMSLFILSLHWILLLSRHRFCQKRVSAKDSRYCIRIVELLNVRGLLTSLCSRYRAFKVIILASFLRFSAVPPPTAPAVFHTSCIGQL